MQKQAKQLSLSKTWPIYIKSHWTRTLRRNSNLYAANSALRKIISLNTNYTVTSYLTVKRSAFYLQIKMCHSARQNKGLEFCLTRSEVVPWKNDFSSGEFANLICKFNLQKITSQKSRQLHFFFHRCFFLSQFHPKTVANCFKAFQLL